MRTALMRDRGFTVLEILIAVFILATALSTVYGAYTGTLRIARDSDATGAIYAMARGTMTRITQDLEAICPCEGTFTFVCSETGYLEAETGGVHFLSRAHIDFKDERSAGIAAITYTIEEGDYESDLRLLRRDELYRPVPGDDNESTAPAYCLCRGLSEVGFLFYDGDGTEYEQWDSASDNPAQTDRAPAAVAITLTFTNAEDGETPYIFMTRVSSPMVRGL